MNGNSGANSYMRTKIMTANPQELRLMLYDGALKFCRIAKDARDKTDHEQSFTNLMRAQKIVLELSTSLNRDVEPQICERMGAVYTYIYRLLVDATVNRDQTKPISEAIELLEYERQTWQLLIEKTGEQQNVTNAQQTAISSLSLNG